MEEMQLSNQALGAIMLALQESLMNQTDIVPILKGFKLKEGTDGLTVMNPPTVRLDDTKVTEEELETLVK
jgi:hypothetical protein